MTDREMLELAAKAAGVDACWPRSLEEWQKDITEPYVDNKPWNPLTDDGDALRLAVKLDIYLRFEWYPSKQIVTACGDGFWIEEIVSDSKEAATRRAIVRAAAEIGRKM